MDEAKVTDKLPVDDGSMKETVDKHPFFFSTRCRVTLHIFCVNMLMYMHRVNLSLAVVCMVGGTHWESNLVPVTNISSDESGNSTFTLLNRTYTHVHVGDPYNVTDVLNNASVEYTTIGKAQSKCTELTENSENFEPELDWQKAQVSFLLSSYFYGCVITQIPGGAMADIFGGKHIVTVALTITSACALLTPVCARASIYLMFIIRILLGLAGGAIFPVGVAIVTAWAPPSERAVIIAFTAAGSLFGTIVSFFTSGFLCAYGFDNGWASIFYIHGLLAVIALCLWVYDSASTPSSHPRISQRELQYIQNANKAISKGTSRTTPWRRLLVSRPLWASFLTQFSFNWSFFTLLINVPLFLKEVLKFNVKENGVFSALPYVCTMVSIIVNGKVANVIIMKSVLKVLITRRIFTAASLLGSGVCLLLAGHLTCEMRHLAVLLLCLASTFYGMAWGGLFINHPEFAGQFAGTALGITNCGGILAATLASMLAGLLTPHGTQSEWQTVFYIAAGFNVFGTLVFSGFSSAKLEPWAVQDITMTVTADGKVMEAKPLNTHDTDQTLDTTDTDKPLNTADTNT